MAVSAAQLPGHEENAEQAEEQHETDEGADCRPVPGIVGVRQTQPVPEDVRPICNPRHVLEGLRPNGRARVSIEITGALRDETGRVQST